MAIQRPAGTRRPPAEVDGVTLAFGGEGASGVGFGVQPGSITVIGPNGAGKTSLFNTISGFYRPVPGGSIRFRGQDITRSRRRSARRMGLGRSFQNIALFRGMTVLDNIKLGRHAHLQTNVLDALFYLGRAPRRAAVLLRADIEERIIDFRRSTTSATPAWRRPCCPMARKSAEMAAPWRCSRRS